MQCDRRETHSDTILDLVLRNGKELVKNLVVDVPVATSAHYSVRFSRDLSISNHAYVLEKNFKTADYEAVNIHLCDRP